MGSFISFMSKSFGIVRSCVILLLRAACSVQLQLDRGAEARNINTLSCCCNRCYFDVSRARAPLRIRDSQHRICLC